MVSARQLKESEKVVVKDFEVRPNFIYITVVYIDKFRHEHVITYDRSIKDWRAALRCPCTFHSSFGINTTKLCIYTIKAMRELVDRKIWKPRILKMIT